MLLSAIKSVFQSKLHPLYPKQEIDSLFYLVVNNLLNYSKIDIHMNPDKNMPPDTEKQMLEILEKLSTGQPVQYVLGKTEFFGCSLNIDDRALIPRQETEFLVDMVVKKHHPEEIRNIIDIGTGSGCIAIALAKSFPNSRISAIDISTEALELAKINAYQNSVKIDLFKDDILNYKATYGIYDIIISNPPYITNSEKRYMHNNILGFEPGEALFVPDHEPLIFYTAIAGFGEKYLSAVGKIYVEINENFGKETAELFSDRGYGSVQLFKDMSNKFRYLAAAR